MYLTELHLHSTTQTSHFTRPCLFPRACPAARLVIEKKRSNLFFFLKKNMIWTYFYMDYCPLLVCRVPSSSQGNLCTLSAMSFGTLSSV